MVAVRIVIGEAARPTVQIGDPDVARAATLAQSAVGDFAAVGRKAWRPRPIRVDVANHSPTAVHDDEREVARRCRTGRGARIRGTGRVRLSAYRADRPAPSLDRCRMREVPSAD